MTKTVSISGRLAAAKSEAQKRAESYVLPKAKEIELQAHTAYRTIEDILRPYGDDLVSRLRLLAADETRTTEEEAVHIIREHLDYVEALSRAKLELAKLEKSPQWQP
jgi:plasmid stability protein